MLFVLEGSQNFVFNISHWYVYNLL